jgi:low affinity Fe/Cu permease
MAIEEGVNASEISAEILWPLVLKAFSPLMTLAKVLGVVVLIYLIYVIIKGILDYNRNKKIDITYEKILEIDKKLDELLKRTAKKEKISEKQEKKKGFFARLFDKKEKKS